MVKKPELSRRGRIRRIKEKAVIHARLEVKGLGVKLAGDAG